MKQAVQVLSQRLSEVLPAMGTTDMDPLILDVDEVANSSGSATSVLPVPSTAVHLHPDVQKKHQRVGLYLQVIGAICLSFMADAASSAPPPGLAYVGGVTAAMLSGVMWVVMPQLHDISPLPVITHTLVLSSTVSGLKSVIFPEAVVPTDVVSLPRVVTEVVVMAALGSIGQISVTRGCQLYPMEPLPVVPFAAGLVSMLVLDAVVCKEYLPAGPTIAVVVAVGATALLILRKPASDVVQPVVAAPE
ncbi:hypothetical protein DYB32_006983 [Aphanomyces invadans]|uniref:Uncharacterized protein n=1 Tax=Aphanomyces invadans TaxID=157072 RepID=A0A418AXA1_9STRA|nr:hypothetical protein DYB32_006983 [Aphanomyces invadans]